MYKDRLSKCYSVESNLQVGKYMRLDSIGRSIDGMVE